MERIREMLIVHDYDPFYWFSVSPDGGYLALFFDSHADGKSFDLLMMNLRSGTLEPIYFANTNGDVAFDRQNGFYFVQIDGSGRGTSLFRHQLPGEGEQDEQVTNLVYEEPNSDYGLNLHNSLSGDFIVLDICSTYSPRTNEIWLKHTSDEQQDFSLVQGLRFGVRY